MEKRLKQIYSTTFLDKIILIALAEDGTLYSTDIGEPTEHPNWHQIHTPEEESPSHKEL